MSDSFETVIVDQSAWGKLRVTGEDRERFLQGMFTNDLSKIPAGGFLRAATLNPKGRVLGVADAVAEPDAILLIIEPLIADKVRQVLEKHAIMDDVFFTPVELPCHRVWADPASVWSAPPVFSAAVGSSEAAVEARRIEGGLPRYGADVSEEYFPFEAHLEQAISYTKGCYIGQETVARAHARGHANKRLVGLRVEGELPLAAGALVVAEARPEAGIVTSWALSPRFGVIALAYVHKSAWDAGTKVRVGERDAVVTELPFA